MVMGCDAVGFRTGTKTGTELWPELGPICGWERVQHDGVGMRMPRFRRADAVTQSCAERRGQERGLVSLR